MSSSPQQVAATYVSQEGGSEASPSMTQTPAFFLANYRLGKTLGNGSFGKVSTLLSCCIDGGRVGACRALMILRSSQRQPPRCLRCPAGEDCGARADAA